MTETGYWHVRWQVGGGCFVPTSAPDGQLQGEILDGLRIQVGDRLWGRKAHYLTDDGDYERAVCAVDDEEVREHLATMERLKASHPQVDWSRHARLRPGIHMPHWASRLTLTVADVRVQRLQDIREEDARAEGVYLDAALWTADGVQLWQQARPAGDSGVEVGRRSAARHQNFQGNRPASLPAKSRLGSPYRRWPSGLLELA